MEVLEHRRALLGVLRASLTEPSVYLRIGAENPTPGLHSRLDRRRQLRPRAPQPRRGVGDRPGADGLPGAIIAVRQAARELSRFVAEVYDE